ncbi:MAG: archaeal proteasome endopeptidase complex subunit alpha [Candidatus Lokiarchaeota archaeon]|nr:archaeal proteasome endopeptidase complex subunit alpha [Candidatus Lokiarchaeota archaeon]MBD3201576.1 archaeal proteasome endopeptidase complex subunit alpha [Candidatus Lokiarchaeota archaeon]
MFGGGQVKYDRALTVFSPEGRLYQVEYALEAVRRGTLAVAVKAKEHVVLAAQIKIPSPLMNADEIDKLFQVDDHIGCAISGLHADSRALINYARVQAQSFRLTYDEPVRVNMLVKTIADVMQQYTQFGGIRPWGCALFFIGFDEMGTQIYTTSPSGIYRSFRAYALGNGEAAAREYLRNNYKKGFSFDDTVITTLNALKEGMDDEATKDNVRLAYIKSDTKKFTVASKDEIESFLTKAT